MDNQTFIIACLITCSLGGWYVVISKYLALKHMIKDPDDEMTAHIPGMGPPPISHEPFSVAPDLMQSTPNNNYEAETSNPAPNPQIPITTAQEKRQLCNMACVLHLLGFAIVTGVPFLNVLFP